ncbi:MAG: YlzJ-like family protein [Candidatus Merdivicinus sp.]|jgi:hypothetical protein
MILHTILLPEQIFPAKIPETELHTVNGCLCECISNKEGLCISRLISTNPADFLNPALSPGMPVPHTDNTLPIRF